MKVEIAKRTNIMLVPETDFEADFLQHMFKQQSNALVFKRQCADNLIGLFIKSNVDDLEEN